MTPTPSTTLGLQGRCWKYDEMVFENERWPDSIPSCSESSTGVLASAFLPMTCDHCAKQIEVPSAISGASEIPRRTIAHVRSRDHRGFAGRMS